MSLLYNTGSVDVSNESVSALSNALNDGASDDRAIKCCISTHYRHNGRKRLLVVETTSNNDQCMYIANCLVNS